MQIQLKRKVPQYFPELRPMLDKRNEFLTNCRQKNKCYIAQLQIQTIEKFAFLNLTAKAA